ncbi:hypothetical protein SCHPADRAFT_995496 [Schizopora paradoxa]|uniref:Uncharacterized protein n=1 Tax=Schizopora paradoxa TaxID=27342 RepID=A0A0H2RVH6_9AGAM|nr:hypothetical protein SCHPADRAFT_995496 [Schizopora paradoxa]
MSRAPDISVLPPELLENTFNLTIQSISAQDRVFQTLAFSHVCRTFRDVALNSPRLWTSLPGRKGDGFSKPAFIEACIERSKDLPMDVALWVHYIENDRRSWRTQVFFSASNPLYQGFLVDKTFEWILLRCARWRSCSLHFDYIPEVGLDQEYRAFCDLITSFQNINAPLLEDLLIKTSTASGICAVTVPLLSNTAWNLPGLVNLSIDDALFPIPPQTRPQLRSVVLKLSSQEYLQCSRAINTCQDLLPMMTCLSTFRLSLVGCRCNFFEPSKTPFVEIPSVEFVDVTLLGCTSDESHNLWKEFRKFHFPNAIEMTVTLDIGDRDEFVLWEDHNIALYSLLAQSPDDEYLYRYPSLELLVVNVRSSVAHLLPRGSGKPRQLPTLLLPCCCVPSLKHLKIWSPAAHWKLLDGVGEFDASSQPPYFRRAGEVTAISLETATFDVPDVDGIVPWMKQLTSKMRATSCWERFSELTIIQSGDEVVIPREEVGRWCEEKA